MIITIRLVNTSINSHNYGFFVGVVRTLKIYSLSNFQVYNTVLLTIITMLYIRREKKMPVMLMVMVEVVVFDGNDNGNCSDFFFELYFFYTARSS